MSKPASQGDLDSLCGLYAFHNAMSLLFPGLHLGHGHFGRRIDVLGGAGHKTGPHDALTRNAMLDLAKGSQNAGPLAERFAFETPWWGSTPALASYWDRVHAHVADGGCAVIGFYPDSWSMGHWSVVEAATDATFKLRDSSGARQVKRHLARVGPRYAQHARRPWRLEPASTFLFARAT